MLLAMAGLLHWNDSILAEFLFMFLKPGPSL